MEVARGQAGVVTAEELEPGSLEEENVPIDGIVQAEPHSEYTELHST